MVNKGADINEKDKYGYTALHAGTTKRNELTFAASLFFIKYLATAMGRKEIVDILTNSGAQIRPLVSGSLKFGISYNNMNQSVKFIKLLK